MYDNDINRAITELVNGHDNGSLAVDLSGTEYEIRYDMEKGTLRQINSESGYERRIRKRLIPPTPPSPARRV